MTNEKRIFEQFLDYWNTIIHRWTFEVVETFIRTSMIFSSLKYYWIINFNGDLTSAMNYLDQDFDPNTFINKESLYSEKLLDLEIEQ